jgi:FkbM family methyltransferase
MTTYSQLNQDVDVIQFYKNKENGYFIEIGANDGINLSNSYLLEKNYNWKGICVEPIPDIFNKLKNNRPNSICVNKAIYSYSDIILKFNIASCDLLSGIVEHINCHKSSLNNGKIIDVQTISMNDLLDNNNAPNFIDYLSIDTEGSEFEILKTIDYDKYTFGIIHVEHNYVEPQRTNMKEFLLSKNYVYKRENKWDDEYIHKSLLTQS